ncbi:MAG: NAD(P)-dependent oxidoreductase [Desulfuromonas sp.]|nr:MAG: NAD(P)-dependent oxidoreductase [Desulfuromonas sp.]
MAHYGFLGLGIMGRAMAANLLKAGHKVTVWNRSVDKCAPLVELGATVGDTPRQITAECEITFAMLADPDAARAVCSGADGVAAGIGGGRGYVDMSTVDDLTAQEIAAAVTAAGGRFLEAPVSGTKKPAEDGTLIILAAGDESLYRDALPAFEIMGKMSPFLGAVGQGARMKLVVNMIMGGMLTAFGEGVALALESGLDGEKLLEVLANGALGNPMFASKGALLLKENYPTSFPLKHMQKDLRLALQLGDRLGQPLVTAATANEIFKRARAAGHADDDIAAVYTAIHEKKCK